MSVGKKEKINVLSLFDGMSCGQIALNRVGIEYDKYFANIKFSDDYLRIPTPLECERLQTVPDNYTNVGLLDSHRYKMLGNGWTVDVIAHIFSFLKGGEIFNNFTNENV